MTAEELLQRCQKMGLQGTAVHDCLRGLESILLNPEELTQRKDQVRAFLQSFSQGSTSEPGVIEAKRLVDTYPATRTTPTPPPDPAFMKTLRTLLYPEDPAWLPLLHRARALDNAAGSRAYGQRLVEMTAKALQKSPASRNQLLLQCKPLIDGVLTHLSPQLTVADRLQIKSWAEDITCIEEQERVAQLQAQLQDAWAGKDWDAAEVLARELEQMGQQEVARSALARVREYRHWRHLFDHVLQALTAYHTREPLVFPWDPTAPLAIGLPELLDSARGLEKWGKDDNRRNWSQALEHVSAQILQRLQNTAETVVALDTLQQLQRTWPATLGGLPLIDRWEALQAARQEQIRTQIEEQLDAFRQAYDGTDTVRGLLERNVGLQRLMSHAPARYQQCLEQEQSLRTLQRDLQSWHNYGDPHILHDETLVKAEHVLKELAGTWGQAPLHQQLTEASQALREELLILDEVSSYLKQGRLRQAMEILQPLASPAAQRLRRQAEQYVRDERVQSMITAGRLTEIEATDLQAVSADVRIAYEAVKRGQEYVATFRRRLDGLEQHSRFSIYSKEGLQMLREPLPDKVRLSEPDEAACADVRNELMRRVDQRAERESEYLRAECQPWPLLEPEKLAVLQKRCDDLLEGLQLTGFDRKLAEVVHSRIAAARLILEVQQSCYAGQWEQARALVDTAATPLNVEQRRRLRATLRSQQYLAEGADDSAWMTLYTEVPELLLQTSRDRQHYLELLRRASLSTLSFLGEHLNILQKYFPEEAFLIYLLNFVAEPIQRQEQRLSVMPQREDEVVLQRLFSQWSNELEHYRGLRNLWELLDEPLRRQVWNETKSPLQKLQHTLNDRLRDLAACRREPKIGIF